ncbi:hypothetical protein [Paracoccus alkenifer]|nr:hypothetical protein [Paracoccus alkenifer]
MELALSHSVAWSDRASLPDRAGVYFIARGEPANTVYIGWTWGAKDIHHRIRMFHSSATTGHNDHAGGLTFYGVFDDDTAGLLVAVHLPDCVDPRPETQHPYIAYAKQRLIWKHVRVYGGLLVCNSE